MPAASAVAVAEAMRSSWCRVREATATPESVFMRSRGTAAMTLP
jgi:hypothetical protein